ncbi:MAG: serine hydrolase [Bacteroidales bacterium]|nr:serine hydrolase [Bacteroidales bacterium]
MKKLEDRKFKIKLICIIISIIIITGCFVYFIFFHDKEDLDFKYPAPFLSVDPAWADTTLKYMSLEEKLGQLIFYNAENINNDSKDSVLKVLYETNPGGISFTTDSLGNFVRIQNTIQKISKINLFTLVPSKTGTGEFKDIPEFPTLHNLFAVEDDSLKTDYLKSLTKINKKLNISFSSFPLSRFESTDSTYSDDYYKILSAYIKEFSNNKTLTSINDANFLNPDSFNFIKNKNFISAGLSGVIYNKPGFKSENPYDLKDNLNKLYNFGGIIFADIDSLLLSEEEIIKYFNNNAEMFFTNKPKELIILLLKLVKDEKINIEKINKAVRKILLAKTWVEIDQNICIDADSIQSEINDISNIITKRAVYRNSVTLIRNSNNQIPYKSLKNRYFNLIEIGSNKLSSFYNTLNEYYYVKSSYFDPADSKMIEKIEKIKKRSDIIVSINNYEIDTVLINALLQNNSSKTLSIVNFGKSENLQFLDSFKTIIQVYGNSEFEQKFAADALFGGIAVKGKLPVYVNDSLQYGLSVKIDKVRVSKSLPEEVGLNSNILLQIDSIAKNGIRRGAFPGCQIVIFKSGNVVLDKTYGFHTYSKQRRVRKSDLYDLASITKIAATTLAAMRMYDKGRIRLDDKLGKFFRDTGIDYSNIKPDTIINIDTLLIADIKDFKKLLRYQDTLHINDSMLIAYDSLIVTTTPKNNIFKVRIKDILLHKSGITPTLPILPYLLYQKNYYDSLEFIKQRFYKNLKADTLNYNPNIQYDVRGGLNKIYNEYFSRRYIKDSAQTKIADNFYFQNRYFDTLWNDTKRLRVYSRKIYQYSDINMILLQQAIDSLNRSSIDKYLSYNIYKPMGLTTMCYKPTKYFSRNRITPTENEKYWRQQTLRGNVHDPSAAMLGGVSGNAGLFSDAYDLALLGQMWLNGGSYGGVRYISKSTINKFTGYQEDSHRGLGFDKPGRKSIIGNGAPPESFGHTGFTGTCIWVDPVNDLVYVFLSNRVHPNQKNWRINTYKIRQKIHSVVYNAM